MTIKKGFRFQLCGKIEFRDNHGTSRSGYIIDETVSHFQVLCFDNRIINIRRPKYNLNNQIRRNRERISYELDTTNLHSGITENSDDLFQVTMIYPVRIQIIKNADINLKILGKYLVTTFENKIDEVKSKCKFIFYLCYLICSFAMEKEIKQSQ